MEQKTSSFDRVLGAWDILVIAFGALDRRLIVAFGGFTQQTVAPVAVGDLSGRVDVTFFQITGSGVKTDFRSWGRLRFFTLNVHQPARRTVAIENRRRPFQNINALNQQRIDPRFGIPGDVIR